MSSRRRHFYMGTALVQFSKDGKSFNHYTNFIIQAPERKITASTLQDANRMVAQMANQEIGLEEGELKNIVFMSWNYLGLMSEREFTGSKAASEPTFDA